MKYLVVSLFLFFFTLQTFGQQDYFIYLQTDNSQAFYIRINNNVYSSTGSGYLLLSKMPDSTVNVTIGFPKNVFPDQQFNIPVNHRDAGYVLKNFGDKGWGLFNLQTMAVIMTSTPPQEKKSPEITGIKKTDPFSLLLANAVNDTAVLYIASKPAKLVTPPAVAVNEEKKRDSVLIVQAEKQKPDSHALATKTPEKTDSSLAAKNNATPKKDSVPGIAHAPVEKGKVEVGVGTSVVKNNPPPVVVPEGGKNSTVKNNPTVKEKNVARPGKDAIIISNAPQPVTAKTNSGRKDTIIMMKGKTVDDSKPFVKNTVVPKENKPATVVKKDSVQLVKNDAAKKPEEKQMAASNNPPAVVIQNVPSKDTAAAIAKNESIKPLEEKPDSIVTAPVKRSRPLVSKAAEILTDTSYVAVFVDESKDRFDTIRISIPFDEYIARTMKQRAPVADITLKENAVDAGKTTKDNLPPLTVSDPVTAKKDTLVTAKTATDTPQIVQQQVATAVPKEAAATEKAIKDSTAVALSQQPVMPVPVPVRKDSVPVVVQQVPPPIVKKDTVTTAHAEAVKDSGKEVKSPAQPLFLNSDCKEIAQDIDIDKLRIKMLLVESDDDRITLAKKVYRQKCFYVKHVRALSELFKTDEGKYKWFDAVYPFVTDTGNFGTLGELIKNEYYLNRFKAMLRN